MKLTPFEKQLVVHEGYRRSPYKDSVGKLTVGIGRNLDDVGVRFQEAVVMLQNDMKRARAACEKQFPWFSKLSAPRQEVLVNMCFNMGMTRLLGFRKMLSALEAGEFGLASKEMLDSKWAGQVGQRASELAMQMRENMRLDYDKRYMKEVGNVIHQ